MFRYLSALQGIESVERQCAMIQWQIAVMMFLFKVWTLEIGAAGCSPTTAFQPAWVGLVMVPSIGRAPLKYSDVTSSLLACTWL